MAKQQEKCRQLNLKKNEHLCNISILKNTERKMASFRTKELLILLLWCGVISFIIDSTAIGRYTRRLIKYLSYERLTTDVINLR